ncbi:MAG: hypothetical protein JJ859_19010 [Roseicyclus sp.]|nr:hypothetical protein [Roseicyclus sp.]
MSASASISQATDPPGEFLCRSEGRFLTDEEFLETAFAYEVRERDLPEPFRSLGIAGLRELDPGCCIVQREDNPFNEPRDWLSRLLFDPQVLVTIGWDADLMRAAGPSAVTNYDFTICGELRERRGSTDNATTSIQ